jgi:hypothetical protein
VAPGPWKWPASGMRAARGGPGLLPGVPGAEVMAAVGGAAAAVQWRCGLRSAVGWGAVR